MCSQLIYHQRSTPDETLRESHCVSTLRAFKNQNATKSNYKKWISQISGGEDTIHYAMTVQERDQDWLYGARVSVGIGPRQTQMNHCGEILWHVSKELGPLCHVLKGTRLAGTSVTSINGKAEITNLRYDLPHTELSQPPSEL